MRKVLVCGKRARIFQNCWASNFTTSNYARKYTKRHEMDQITTLDNLGTPRTENLLINIKYLIQPIPREFNFRGIRLFGKFSFSNFCRVSWMPNSPTGISNLSRGYFIPLPNGRNHQDKWFLSSDIGFHSSVQIHALYVGTERSTFRSSTSNSV